MSETGLRTARESVATALGVFLGLTWGYALQQTDQAGRAIFALEVSNSTSTFGYWVAQTQASLVLVFRATAVLSMLFVAYLLIPRIRTRPAASSVIQAMQDALPVVAGASWFIMLFSAMAASISLTTLPVNITCGPTSSEATFAMREIVAFLAFARAYVAAAGVLSLFMGIWLASSLTNRLLDHRRFRLRLPAGITMALAVFFTFDAFIPLQTQVSGPCISMPGAVDYLPWWWAYVATPFLFIFSLVALLLLKRPKKSDGMAMS